MSDVLGHEEIEVIIPHRFENLLVDQVDVDDSSEQFSSDLRLTIRQQDERGRDIFLSQFKGDSVVSIPVYAEIMALASIVACRSKVKDGYTTIFAGISNFSRQGFNSVNTELTGTMNLLTDRKGFYKYEGILRNNHGQLCSSQLTAFYTPSEALTNEEVSDLQELEVATLQPINKEERVKRAEMVICDGLNEYDEQSFVAQYTYPEDHPLVKGHFPDQGVMMGIMQWMSVEDSMCAYLEATQKSGERRWSASFKLVDAYNRAVADITDIELDSYINCDGILNQVHTSSVKKIIFKKIVNPGERLYIQSTHIEEL